MLSNEYNFYLGIKKVTCKQSKVEEQENQRLNIDTGELVLANFWYTSAFLLLPEREERDKFLIASFGFTYDVAANNVVVCFYDLNNNFLEGHPLSNVIELKDNVKRLRFSVNTKIYTKNRVSFALCREIAPIYGEDLVKRYSMPDDEYFYRESIDGKFSIFGEDYEYIRNQKYNTKFLFFAIREDIKVINGSFNYFDLYFDDDDQFLTFSISQNDRYTNILNGKNNKFKYDDVALKIHDIGYFDNFLLQLFLFKIEESYEVAKRWGYNVLQCPSGDSVTTHPVTALENIFFNKNKWQEEVKDNGITSIKDVKSYELTEKLSKYHFGQCQICLAFEERDVSGIVTGFYPIIVKNNKPNNNWSANVYNIYPGDKKQLTIVHTLTPEAKHSYTFTILNYTQGGSSIIYNHTPTGENDILEGNVGFNITFTNNSTTLTMVENWILFARFLNNTGYKVGSTATPVQGWAPFILDDDIFKEKYNMTFMNYTALYPFDFCPPDFKFCDWSEYDSLPNYGKNIYGFYQVPTNKILYTPLAEHEHTPYMTPLLDVKNLDTKFQTNMIEQIIKNKASSLFDEIRNLISKLDDAVIFEKDEKYSKFFFSNVNPATNKQVDTNLYTMESIYFHDREYKLVNKTNDDGTMSDELNLVVTYRSDNKENENIEVSLNDYLELLRALYDIYWFIDDDGRFHLENVKYFYNCYDYSDNNVISGYDLTYYVNAKVGFTWDFVSNKWSVMSKNLYERIIMRNDANTSVINDPFYSVMEYPSSEEFVDKNLQREENINGFETDIIRSTQARERAKLTVFTLIPGERYPMAAGKKEVLFEYSASNIMSCVGGDLCQHYLAPIFKKFNLPNKKYLINNEEVTIKNISKIKIQEVTFPGNITSINEDIYKFVITSMGKGQIKELQINLTNEMINAKLLLKPEDDEPNTTA